MNKFKKLFLAWLFYGSSGLAAALLLSLVFYWSLNLNSSISSLINNTKSEPVYLWSYALLTIGTIIFFGVNASLFVYRWRKFGPPRLKVQGSVSLSGLRFCSFVNYWYCRRAGSFSAPRARTESGLIRADGISNLADSKRIKNFKLWV